MVSKLDACCMCVATENFPSLRAIQYCVILKIISHFSYYCCNWSLGIFSNHVFCLRSRFGRTCWPIYSQEQTFHLFGASRTLEKVFFWHVCDSRIRCTTTLHGRKLCRMVRRMYSSKMKKKESSKFVYYYSILFILNTPLYWIWSKGKIIHFWLLFEPYRNAHLTQLNSFFRGGEDNDFFSRVSNKLNIIRLHEAGLTHVWHPKHCSLGRFC